MNLPRLCAVCLALVLILSSAAACTVVQIHETGGAVTIQRKFGFVSLEVCQGAETVLVDLRGAGLAAGFSGVTLGAFHEEIALPGRKCQLILWVESEEQLRLLRELLGEHPSICSVLINPKGDDP